MADCSPPLCRNDAMACVHLRRLYQLCQQQGLKLGGSDLIHLVCEQCGVKEECPSVFLAEYEATNGLTGNSELDDEDSDLQRS